MSVTFGDVRRSTLALLDEYDTAGAIKTTSDVTVKIRDFTNKALVDLAGTTAKIHGEHFIVHAPVNNDSINDASGIKTFLPDKADISISLAGAKSCYFEATGPGTAIIEEAALGSDTYTNIETITIPATVTEFTEYRRLIAPGAATNTVRLRFTGSCVFNVRNYVLYPYTWSSQADVQQNRPYFCYDLPSDFLQLDNVMVRKDVRRFVPYTTFDLRPDKTIWFDRYDAPAEFLVHYWRMPTLFIFTENEVMDDAMVFGIDTSGATPTYRVDDAAALIIPFFNAAHVLLSEGSSGLTSGAMLLNIYETRKVFLVTNKIGAQSHGYNILGW
ncbi:MAG: hypothetical protein A4E53_00147 [Pelotomaculum sp. PtaB.Bin104]|nr:MAG: hypothetical protein A4E53_00147 [Pelotomaculum sp. PtaB.Bin104]